MACSAIYFLDNKGKVLISRNYRGDIETSAIDKFIGLCLVHYSDGVSFIMSITLQVWSLTERRRMIHVL